MIFLRSPFHHLDFMNKFWKSEKNARYEFCGFQNFKKFELKISSIRIIRIICKNSLIRIIRIFGQQINSWKCSRSIWIMVQVRGPGWCCNLVENMLTRLFEGPIPGKFCLKTSPLSRNSGVVEWKRSGREGVLWTCVEKNSPANRIDWISLVYGNIMHCGAGRRTTVTLIIPQLKWLPRTTKLVTHFVEQTCSTDYHRVFRCSEEGQISGFDPLPWKNRCRSARKIAQILKMSRSRRRHVQTPAKSVSVLLR